MAKKYQHAALGGTFDRLHRGHEHLLKMASRSAERLTVGLTTPTLIGKKTLAEVILPYSDRKSELEHYLAKIRRKLNGTKIIALDSVYGTTMTDESIDVIVVTPQTLAGAKVINKERLKRGLATLPVKQAALIEDEAGEYISSTKIRRGFIDRRGKVYGKLYENKKMLKPKQRAQLKDPQGELLITRKEIELVFLKNWTKVALVGDYITQYALDRKLRFEYAVIDGMSCRQVFEMNWRKRRLKIWDQTVNYPGEIRVEAALAIQELMKQESGVLKIMGEEDLLGLPLIHSLPLGSVMFYGQPGMGVVMIEVNEETKGKFARFIKSSF